MNVLGVGAIVGATVAGAGLIFGLAHDVKRVLSPLPRSTPEPAWLSTDPLDDLSPVDQDRYWDAYWDWALGHVDDEFDAWERSWLVFLDDWAGGRVAQ